MKKYVIYARVASRNQADKASSIKHQVELLQKIAKENNLEVTDVITEYSTASQVRKGFNLVLEKLSNGGANGVLCIDLVRLSRNASAFQRIASLIDLKGIQIITPSQIYNSDSDKMFLINLEMTVTNYCQSLVNKRIKAGIRRRLKNKCLSIE